MSYFSAQSGFATGTLHSELAAAQEAHDGHILDV